MIINVEWCHLLNREGVSLDEQILAGLQYGGLHPINAEQLSSQNELEVDNSACVIFPSVAQQPPHQPLEFIQALQAQTVKHRCPAVIHFNATVPTVWAALLEHCNAPL
ncbi:hypothetical protein GOP47_0025764 [Adiantum capillus-veneris]|uniref:Uncharacterized protein n=1 Tax=Adiantum capillus-veneris TaxID=13818 RepID=A0A9D4U1Z4_ADICA|nr:hypothetical protein GOP47_0025764 [Adiantum capillus-veneris]